MPVRRIEYYDIAELRQNELYRNAMRGFEFMQSADVSRMNEKRLMLSDVMKI